MHSATFMDFIIHSLAITGICLILDAIIMATLNLNSNARHTSERSHYLLSIFSVCIYIAAYQAHSETFRDIWMTTLLGLYIYDVCIIARDWRQLKPSYRVFYSVHHGMSFILFALWYVTFIPFTSAMALGALLWVSSDIWRWAEQYWRLSGHQSSNTLRDAVWYLERSHRILAYCIYMWALDFQFQHASEAILIASGILMDIIDAYFQHQARSAYKNKLAHSTTPKNEADEIINSTKKAA